MPAVNEQITDTISQTNMKSLGESGAFAMGLSFQDSVESRRVFNGLQNMAAGNLMRRMSELTIADAAAGKMIGQAGELPPLLARLEAAIATNQQTAKTAANTPPVKKE